MIRPQYAILVDGGFITKKLNIKHRHPATPEEVVAECQRIMAHPRLADYELLRIYFYDARPAKDRLTNPLDNTTCNLAATPVHAHFDRLLNKLELEEDFSLRLGQAVTHGWKIGKRAAADLMANPRPLTARDIVPDIQQKGVDLRIGLDIARLALAERVRAIVVVTGDSDLVPAFKFARREGVRVFLDAMGHGVRRELKVHVDIVI